MQGTNNNEHKGEGDIYPSLGKANTYRKLE